VKAANRSKKQKAIKWPVDVVENAIVN